MRPTWTYGSQNRIIHVIWFGDPFGSRQMPQEGSTLSYKDNLLDIIKGNYEAGHGYRVYLWTDTNSANLKEEAGFKDMHIVNLDELPEPKELGELRSINGSTQLFEKIKIFRGKSPPERLGITGRNYAAASDILRAMVLFKFSGIYLDADTLFLSPFPHSLDLPNNISLGGGENYDSYGLGDLSNDVIAVSRPKVQELGLYLELVNTHMTEDVIKDILIADTLGLNAEGAAEIIEMAKRSTERFGPQLMRFYVMGKECLGEDDYTNFIEDMKKNRFVRSMISFQTYLPTTNRNNSDIYQKFLFPQGYVERGQANAWFPKQIKESTKPIIDQDSSSSSSNSFSEFGVIDFVLRTPKDAPAWDSHSSDEEEQEQKNIYKP